MQGLSSCCSGAFQAGCAEGESDAEAKGEAKSKAGIKSMTFPKGSKYPYSRCIQPTRIWEAL